MILHALHMNLCICRSKEKTHTKKLLIQPRSAVQVDNCERCRPALTYDFWDLYDFLRYFLGWSCSVMFPICVDTGLQQKSSWGLMFKARVSLHCDEALDVIQLGLECIL